MRPSLVGLFTAVFAMLVAGSAAQTRASQAPTVQGSAQVDSARTLRAAQQALRAYWRADSFFAVRRWPGMAIRPITFCEQNIGTYCFGPKNGGAAFGGAASLPIEYATATPQIRRISQKRMEGLYRQVIDKLDGFQRELPGDQWIMGQRVLHRVERAEVEDAADVANTCRSTRWWCAALVGYTSHLLNQTVRAESAFAVALATMPESQRCAWNDLSPLLESDEDSDWYAARSCAERERLNEQLWWLADPLYIEPGNERRSAHYFRLVHAALSRDSEARWRGLESMQRPDWYPRGPSFNAAVVRMGVPSYLTLGAPEGPRRPPMLVLQFRKPYYHFIPALAAARAPLSATVEDWTPHEPTPPEHMRARLGAFSSLPHQVAWFRRGDSALVVAATDMLSDTMFQGERLIATAVVMSKSAREKPRTLRDTLLGASGMYVFAAAPESTLMSLESISAGVGAGRARLATGPPSMPSQRVTLSDILLLDAADATPTSLEEAIRMTAPRTTVPVGQSVGLFWEVYGVQSSDTMEVAISVVEHAPSRLGRLGQRLGVVAPTDSVRVEWTALHPDADRVSEQGIVLNLGALGRGRFTLRLDVAVRGQQAVSVRRIIAIVDP